MREQIATYLFKTVCNHGELLISSDRQQHALRNEIPILRLHRLMKNSCSVTCSSFSVNKTIMIQA